MTVGGNGPLFLIAGPCVIESEQLVFRTAERLCEITRELGVPFVFKTSYDKANRLSIESARGPGLEEGLAILRRLKEKLSLPVLVDVHCQSEVDRAAEVADVLQIPAFLCRQTDLLLAACQTGRAVNIKKGQFLAPWDMRSIVEKAESTGNRKLLVTERGTTFGYNYLVNDMRAIAIMKEFGYPVLFDAGHSVQLPGGRGTASGGQRDMIPVLAQAATAAGCDGIFLEVHPDPDLALSDGPNQLRLDDLPPLLRRLKAIRSALDDGR